MMKISLKMSGSMTPELLLIKLKGTKNQGLHRGDKKKAIKQTKLKYQGRTY